MTHQKEDTMNSKFKFLRRREYAATESAQEVINNMIDDCWRAIRIAYLLIGALMLAAIRRRTP